MSGRDASAPGKVLVSGEYAVLDGAPAIVLAVDRRARVRIAESDGDWHRLSLPGIRDGELEFRVEDSGRVSLREPASLSLDLSLVGLVSREVGLPADKPLRLTLDTRPFFHEATGRKLGLGSSAALAAALAAALLPQDTGSQDLMRTALAAHRHWQSGRGSGVDIAAAVYGGVLAYRTAGTSVEPLHWPEGLHWTLLWSGRPAGTADRVARFRRSAKRASVRNAARRLALAAEDMLSAWSSEARLALDGLAAYTAALQAFDVDAATGIFEAGHRDLVAAAADRPLVYKPCGAGGGDVGMAFALERAVLDRFVVTAEKRGFERVDAAQDPRGAERQ